MQIQANKTQTAKVFPNTYKSRGKTYHGFIVRWVENKQRKRKQFANEQKAIAEAAVINVALLNQGKAQRLLQTTLTEDQLFEAETAFRTLGDTYTMGEAVNYFLANHRPPEYEISMGDAIKYYLDQKEEEGLRDRSLRSLSGTLKAFIKYTGDPLVHEITHEQVLAYLRSLRGKDGGKAKRKTWNAHCNLISQFMGWACLKDLETNRPWRFNNPCADIERFKAGRMAEETPPIATTTPEGVQRIFSTLIRYKGGKLVKAFALAYFAGIRPDEKNGELKKLAARESELINIKTGVIHIPANVAKTKQARDVRICDNLRAWLEAYENYPIIPKGFTSMKEKVRKHFALQHDEMRHSFISYHVGLHRSLGEAALQAGNSESVIRKHYLRLHTKEESAKFFSLVPNIKNKRCEVSSTVDLETHHLKAI